MAQRSALIIDDEPDVTTYLGAILTDAGWEVRTANTVDEGLALAERQAPDAVLLDMMMPERGGLSALIALRKSEKTARVPILIISGIQDTLTKDFADFKDFLAKFKHRQPDAFLDKPVEPALLLKTLDELTGA
jgi:two-component system alkaline phosphatase synthesis response regulator PhoP